MGSKFDRYRNVAYVCLLFRTRAFLFPNDKEERDLYFCPSSNLLWWSPAWLRLKWMFGLYWPTETAVKINSDLLLPAPNQIKRFITTKTAAAITITKNSFITIYNFSILCRQCTLNIMLIIGRRRKSVQSLKPRKQNKERKKVKVCSTNMC